MDSNESVLSTTSMSQEPFQDILLDNVEDGACVQLHGKETRITTNVNTEIISNPSASNKVAFKNITKFEWDHQYYNGSLISATDQVMAYSLKGRVSNSVRVINCQNTSDRVLLKGFTGVINDVAFSQPNLGLLAAVDDAGNLLIWKVTKENEKIEAQLKLHLMADDKKSSNSTTHRIVWAPHMQNTSSKEDKSSESEPLDFGIAGIMTLFYNDVAEVWDINLACNLAEECGSVKVQRSQMSSAFIPVHNDEKGTFTDCELSPFGNVLATASTDGYVKFWQVQMDQTDVPTYCLYQWQPHDGKPVSAATFCDDFAQPEPRVYWRFLLTACSKNTEIKMWCAVTWTCLQVIKFQTPEPNMPVPEMNMVFLRSDHFLVLSDIHRKVLYVMKVKVNLETEKAAVVSLAHYAMAFPVLSAAFMGVEKRKFNSTHVAGESPSKSHAVIDYFSYSDDSKTEDFSTDSEKYRGYLVKLLTIQRRSLQNLEIRYIPDEDEMSMWENDHENTGLSNNNLGGEEQQHYAMENGYSEAPTTEIMKSEKIEKVKLAEDFLGAGDGFSSSPLKPVSTTSSCEKDAEFRSRIFSQEKILHPVRVSTPAETSRDITTSSNPTTPILLTPDAFMASSKNTSRRSEGSISKEVLPSKTLDNTLPSKNEESKDPLSALFVQHTGEEATKAPPSSPAVLRADEVHPVPASIDVTELLQSFRSKTSIAKSPDLISSASALPDDVKQEVLVPTTISAPPGLPRPVNADSPFSGMQSPNVFSSLLLPVSTSNTWPKAPDVTMSHFLPTSTTSEPAFITPVVVTSAGSGSMRPLEMQPCLNNSNISMNSTTDSMLQSFANLQRQQEEMLNSQKQLLDTISKKQTQLQKQFETSQKHSDQHKERLDKAMSSITEQQSKLGGDVRAGRSSVTEGMMSKIDRAVKTEIKRTVLPGVSSSIDEIREKLSSTVAQQLSATDSVMKDTISKSVKSKELTDKVAQEMSKVLQDRIQNMLPDVFMRTLIPAFERLCQAMFQQLSTTYHRGMEENLNQMEKQMQSRLKSESEKLQQLTKETSDIARQLQNLTKQNQTEFQKLQQHFTRNTEDLLKKFEDRISNRITSSMKQHTRTQSEQQKSIVDAVESTVTRILGEKLAFSHPSNGAVPTSVAGVQLSPSALFRPTSVASQQEQILKLLQHGEVNSAFEIALSASDLNVVMYACETADPGMIFNVNPCPLTQPILLSLIQQLSLELATKTELKLKYLQEAVMNLDRTHQVTIEYMHTVLGALVPKLQLAAADPKQPLAKQLRMLSMAAHSLMG